ncbi:MAG: RNA polymerase sigma factor [Clostridiales Family XIII bacterium]|jgi:RNA polymerase sigma-70 factor (ECF subfamily)|nr:RNA polymerase sigma factor [Clostridiales Family XIII bacterium]
MAHPEIVGLAKKAIKGNKASFEELCRRKQQEMLFSAYTVLGNHHDAEDAVQEAIFSMFRNIGKLKTPEAIDAWIFKIVRNECNSIFRKQLRHKADLDVEDEDIIIVEENREFLPEAYAEDAAQSDRLYEIVLGLPEKRRETILMYYYEELSYQEIADITGTSIKTVSANMTNARAMIKKELNLDRNKESELMGVGVSSTVMGQVFKQQADKRVSQESLTAFEQTWAPKMKAMNFPAAKSAILVKVAVIAVSATVILGGTVFATIYFGQGSQGEGAPAAVQLSDAEILLDREISFMGGDDAYEHINPTGAELVNMKDGDTNPTWEIKNSDGEIIYSGTGNTLQTEVSELEATGQFGEYTLYFSLKDKGNNSMTLHRAFEIRTPEANTD